MFASRKCLFFASVCLFVCLNSQSVCDIVLLANDESKNEFDSEMKGWREERGRRSLLLRTSVPRLLATCSSRNSMRLSLADGRRLLQVEVADATWRDAFHDITEITKKTIHFEKRIIYFLFYESPNEYLFYYLFYYIYVSWACDYYECNQDHETYNKYSLDDPFFSNVSFFLWSRFCLFGDPNLL